MTRPRAGDGRNVRDAWAKAIEDAVKSDELSELATQRLMLELEHLGPEELSKLVATDFAAQKALFEMPE